MCVRAVLSWLSCPVCPVSAVPSQLSCPSYPVPAALSSLTSPGMAFPDWASPAKLSWHCWCAPFVLPCSSWPCYHVPVILYSLSSPRCSVWGVLPQLCFKPHLPCPSLPVPAVLSLPSCFECLVLSVLSQMSCLWFCVLAFLLLLGCPAKAVYKFGDKNWKQIYICVYEVLHLSWVSICLVFFPNSVKPLTIKELLTLWCFNNIFHATVQKIKSLIIFLTLNTVNVLLNVNI